MKSLNVAVVADAFTVSALSNHCRTLQLGVWDWHWKFPLFRPDLLFVESAWRGLGGRWRRKIAAYPDQANERESLAQLVNAARQRGIPTVFWNKEDDVHFERFIGAAKLFDHVFTVDQNCLPHYRSALGERASVHCLPFAVDSHVHHFTGFHFKHRRALFAGGFYGDEHPARWKWQSCLFGAALGSGLGLSVVDRHSGQGREEYRFPIMPGTELLPAVSHIQTACLYKDFLVSLNVNTVEDSASMCSRRLLEILACGGVAVTNPALAVSRNFQEFCYAPADRDEAFSLFSRLKDGPNALDLERARAGAEFVAQGHTWRHRLEQVAAVVGL